MNEPIAIKHHFVPKFVLKHFTDRDGYLWVSDVRTRRQKRVSPSGTGYQKDYHRVEVYGYRPDCIERRISSIEHRAAPVVRSLLDTGVLPDGSDREAMLALVALQMMRVPAAREFQRPISERARQGMLEIAWNSRYLLIDRLRQLFPDIEGRHIDALSRADFQFPAGDHTPEMLTMAMAVRKVAFPFLQTLKWSVLKSDAGRLISSDCPVAIYQTPRVGVCLYVALSKHLALFGMRTGPDGAYSALTFRQIAAWNGRLVSQSTKIYSSTCSFPWTDSQGGIATGLREDHTARS